MEMKEKRCPYLLLSLLGVLLVYPYLLGRAWSEFLLVALNATVVITGIYAVRHTKKHLTTALAIGIPQLVVSWLNVLIPGGSFAIIGTFIRQLPRPQADHRRESRPSLHPHERLRREGPS